jgi:hypothetical protein
MLFSRLSYLDMGVIKFLFGIVSRNGTIFGIGLSFIKIHHALLPTTKESREVASLI